MERPSPRNTSRRVPRALAVLCILAVATGAAVLPVAQADDDLHKKKKQVQQGIKVATGDLEDSSKALSAALHKLVAARTQLVTAEKRLAATEGQLTAARILDAQMQAKLVHAEAALAQAEKDVKDSEAAVKQQRADIGRLAATDYQYGDPRLLGMSMVLTSQDPQVLASQLNTVDNLMSRETTMLDDLKAREALLEVQRDKVAKARAAVAEQRKVAAANLVRRQALEREAAADRARVATLVAARTVAARKARQIRRHDQITLAALKKKERRIQAQILAKAHHGGSYNGETGGFLYRPVPGPVTSPFGWRRHPIYGYWGLHDGTDFAAACGTPMHAGASGRVISEYYSSVWGNRLYLDVGQVNGKHMVLIYNHASGYRVHTGARVSRGEVVAYAGTTGWSTGCHLHFTVMLDGRAVDPMQFM